MPVRNVRAPQRQARLLRGAIVQPQNEIRHPVRFLGGNVRMRRHRPLSPNAHAALNDFFRKVRARSVVARIPLGHRRKSRPDRRRFLEMARAAMVLFEQRLPDKRLRALQRRLMPLRLHGQIRAARKIINGKRHLPGSNFPIFRVRYDHGVFDSPIVPEERLIAGKCNMHFRYGIAHENIEGLRAR